MAGCVSVEDARQTVRVRRLAPGDEAVVARLAEQQPARTALLADDRVRFVVAFDGDDPVGFAFGYELPRRHGRPATFFVYEIGVDEPYRRRGIGRRLMAELLDGHEEAFVLTEPDNDPANALYASLGGTRVDSVMWDF
jgi:ribosomal protein S18 acetylase RimI-like enzyme